MRSRKFLFPIFVVMILLMSSLVAVVAGIAINYNKKGSVVEDVLKEPRLAETFIEIGQSVTIECPEGYSGVAVTTSDKTIAAVDDLTITARNPGSVTITFYASGAPAEVSANDGSYTQNWIVMVNKKTNPLRVNASALQYTGEEQQLLSVAGAVGEVRYYLTDSYPPADYSEWSVNIPTAKEVGMYTVYWYCEGDEEYRDTEGSVQVAITTGLNQVNIQPVNNYYTGSALELVREMGVPGSHGNVYYSLTTPLNASNYKSVGSQRVPTATNVGEYTVYWYCTGNATSSNASGYVVSQIKVGTNNISIVGLNHIYDGEPKALVQEDGVGGAYGTVYYSTVTALGAKNYQEDGSTAIPTASAVGMHMVYWYCTGNEWFDEATGVACGVINASNEQPDIVGVETDYNGQAQELIKINENVEAYGDIYYSVTEALNAGNYSSSGTKTVPTSANIGEYTIYWYCKENDNYSASFGVVQSYINVGENKVAIVGVEHEFDGNDVTLAVENGVKGAYGDVYYSVSELLTKENYSTAGTTVAPKAKYGGVYNVYWYCTGNEYYEDVSGSVVSTITSITLAAPTGLNFSDLGVASWNAVPTIGNVIAYYECQLYRGAELVTTREVYNETSVDWSSYMLRENAEYTFKVRAKSNRPSSAISNAEYTVYNDSINTYIVYFNVNNESYGTVNPESAVVLSGWVIDGSTNQLKANGNVVATATAGTVQNKIVRFKNWDKSFGTFENGETITAEFEIKDNTFVVKYNANGGTGSMPDEEIEFNAPYNLSPCGFDREGYTFLGWDTDMSATTPTYKSRDSINMLQAGLVSVDNPEVTLYAIWQSNGAQAASVEPELKPDGGIGATSGAELKQEDGVKAQYTEPNYVTFSTSWVTSQQDKTKITGITFSNSEPDWAGAYTTTPVNGVTVYHGDTVWVYSDSLYYDPVIGWSGTGILAPDSCINLFAGFTELEKISLSNLDTTNVTNMEGMFSGCTSLTSISWGSFNTSNVTDMSSMFEGCSSLKGLNLSNFDTSKVTDMSSMFKGCSGLTSLSLDGLDTSSVTTMASMFEGCSSLTGLALKKLNTSNVQDMSNLLADCTSLKNGTGLPIANGSFTTKNVTNMSGMFKNCDGLTSLNASVSTTWITSKVTDMSYMFYDCDYLEELNIRFNTRAVKNMSYMFSDCHNLRTLSLGTFDTSSVTDMSYMFKGCSKLYNLDLSDFTISSTCNTTDMLNLTNQYQYVNDVISGIDLPNSIGKTFTIVADVQFYAQSTGEALTPSGTIFGGYDPDYDDEPSIAGYIYEITSSYAGGTLVVDPTVTAQTLPEATTFHNSLETLVGMSVTQIATIEFIYQQDLPTDAVYKNVIDGTYINVYVHSASPNRVIISHPYKIYAPANSQGLFSWSYMTGTNYDSFSPSSISFDNFDTSRVTNMAGMFSDHEGLKTLDLSGFDTSNVTNMNGMFRACDGLTSVDLSSFDTSKVTNMGGMFEGCHSLSSLDLSSFNFKSITSNLTAYPLLSNLNYMMYNLCYSDSSLTKLILPSADRWGNVTGIGINSSIALYCEGTPVNTSQTESYMTPDVISKTYAGKTLSVPAFLPSQATFHSKLESLTGLGTESIMAISFGYTGQYSLDGYTYLGTLDTAGRISVYGDSSKTYLYIVSDYDIIAPTSCSLLFGTYTNIPGFPNLEILSLGNFYTSTTTSFNAMFKGAKSLRSIDVSRFDSSRVTVFYGMFLDCNNLEYINFGTSSNSKFSFASATDINSMFANCVKLKNLDFSGIVSGGTGSIKFTATMFYRCYVLRSIIGLDKINLTNVTNAHSMFMECENLVSIPALTMNKLEKAYEMFAYCKALTSIDISAINTSKVADFSRMFAQCINLQEIIGLNIVDRSSGENTLTYTMFSTVNATNMTHMFYNCKKLTEINFDGQVSAKVTDMSNMFNGCVALNTLVTGDNWDTSKVTNMNSMFSGCHALATDITLNVTSVQSLYRTFYECWDITNITLTGTMNKVTNMFQTFYDCDMLETITFPSTMNTDNVTDMIYLFGECPKLKTINNVDKITTPSVTSLYGMFDNCSSLTSLKLSFNTTLGVSSMSLMFRNCSSLTTLTIDGFYTSGVKAFRHMFDGCSNLTTISVYGAWNTYNAVDMAYMFSRCEKLTSLPDITWDTSKVTDMSGMFKDCKKLTSVDTSNFTGSTVTNTASMFQGCSSLTGTINLSGLDLSNVTDARHMFYGCSAVSTIILNDRELGDFDKLVNVQAMFYGCKNLTSLTLPSIIHPSTAHAMFQGCEKLQSVSSQFYGCDNTSYMFYNCYELTTISFASSAYFLMDQAKNVDFMFANCYKLTSIGGLTGSDTAAISFTSMDSTFMNCRALTSLNFGSYNASNLTSLRMTFYGCESLTSLDLSKWNTSKVTSMYHTFTDCYELTTLKLSSNFTTANSTNNRAMFQNCYKLVGTSTTVGLEGTFDLGKTTDVYGMFYNNRALTKIPTITCNNIVGLITSLEKMFTNCKELTTIDLNIGYIGSSNTRDMFNGCSKLQTIKNCIFVLSNADAAGMFNGCSSLTNVPINNTSSFINMYMMFNGCSSLTSVDVLAYDVSKVTSMEYMFNNCSSLTSLDLSDWQWGGQDTVRSMSHMFANCQNLTEIKGIENFRTKNVTTFSRMFYNCVSLTKLALNGNYEEDGPWQLSSANNMHGMFQVEGASKPSQLHTINLCATTSGWTSTFENATGMFYGLSNLTNLTLPQYLHVVSAHAMFHGCSKLETITYLDGLYTSNATNLSSMFAGCNKLTTATISVVEDWNTSNVTNMENMFSACAAITSLDLSRWDTSKVTDMSNMFAHAWRINTLKLSGCTSTWNSSTDEYDIEAWGWDTDQVTDMSTMFQAASGLKTLDIHTFDLSGITSADKVANIFDFYSYNNIEWFALPSDFGMFSELDMTTGSHLTMAFFNEDDYQNYPEQGLHYYGYHLVFDPKFDTTIPVSVDGYTNEGNLIKRDRIITLDANGGMFGSDVTTTEGCVDNFRGIENKDGNITKAYAITGYITWGAYPLPENPPTPIADGYAFDYWSLTKSGTIKMVLDGTYWYPENESYSNQWWNAFESGNVTIYAIYKTGDAIFPERSIWEARMGKYGITTDQIISISFLTEHSSGYTKIGTMYDSGVIEIWTQSTSDGVHVQFVWDTPIYAPLNSAYLFMDLTSIYTFDFSNFDTSKAEHMYYMFVNAGASNGFATNNVGLEKFDTSNVKSMMQMFWNARVGHQGVLSGISNWNTSKVEDMNSMFLSCNVSKLDLSGWDTSNVTDMGGMLWCDAEYIDISGFDISKVTDTNIIGGAARIIELPATFGEHTSIRVNSEKNYYYTENNNPVLVNKDDIYEIPSTYAGKTVATDTTFRNDWKEWLADDYGYSEPTAPEYQNITEIKFLYNTDSLEGWENVTQWTELWVLPEIFIYKNENALAFVWPGPIFAPENSSYMFANGNAWVYDFTNFNTSRVTNMSNMFDNHSGGLSSLDLSGFDVSNVTDMSYMFGNATIQWGITFGDWDTSNVTNMDYMFTGFGMPNMQQLEGKAVLDISSFTNLGSTNYMFWGAYIDEIIFNENITATLGVQTFSVLNVTSLDLSNWTASNNMREAFLLCSKLEYLNISGLELGSAEISDMLNFGETNEISTLVLPKDFGTHDTIDICTSSQLYCSECVELVVDGTNTTTIGSEHAGHTLTNSAVANVTFEYKNGQEDTRKTIPCGAPYGTLPVPNDMEGYKFDGWYGKNLLDVAGRTLYTGDMSGENTTVRNFEFDKYYVGLTMNNYYYPHSVTSYSVENGVVTVTPNNSGYGVGFPVKVEPNTKYALSGNAGSSLGLGFYNESGEFINNFNEVQALPYTFTTPANCGIITIVCRPVINTTATYSNLQLELGDSATTYTPYVGSEKITAETIMNYAFDHILAARWIPEDDGFDIELDENLFAHNNVTFDSTFESNVTGGAVAASGASVSVTTDKAFNGTRSLKYNTSGASTNKYIYYSTTLAAGTYTFGAYVMADKDVDGYILIQNSDLTSLAEISVQEQEANIWHYVTAQFTLTAETVVQFAFYGTDGANHYVDDITLVKDDDVKVISITYNIATGTIKLPYSAKEGYTFLGWNVTRDASTAFMTVTGKQLFDFAKAGYATLYAQYKISNPATRIVPAYTEVAYNDQDVVLTAQTQATFANATYQWYVGTTKNFECNSTTLIGGATGSTYTHSKTNNAGTYYYRCMVTTLDNPIASTLAVVVVKKGTIIPGPIPSPGEIMEDYQYANNEQFTAAGPTYVAESGGAVSFYYYSASESKSNAKLWSNMTSTTLNVGDYKIYAVVAETANYNSYESDVDDFTVNPGDIIVSFTANGGTKTTDGNNVTYTKDYDGLKLDVYISANVAHTLKYGATTAYGTTESRGANSPLGIASATNAGTVVVYYEVSKTNYTSVSGTVTIVIDKPEYEVHWDSYVLDGDGSGEGSGQPGEGSGSTAKRIVYNGTDQSAEVRPYIMVGGEKVYCTIVTFTIGGQVVPFVNAATYTVTASFAHSNYILINTVCQVPINKMAVAITAGNAEIEYGDGNDVLEPRLSGTASPDLPTIDKPYTINYAIYDDSALVTDVSTLDAGTYEIRPSIQLPEGRLESNFKFTHNSGTLTVNAIDLKDAEFEEIEDQVYTGSAITPTPQVTLKGKVLVAGTDFTFSYTNNVNVGTASIAITAKYGSNYTGTASTNFKIVPKLIQKPNTTGINTQFTYNCMEQGFDIAASDYYTISNNKATVVGNYTAIISLNDKVNYAWTTDGVTNAGTDNIAIAWSINKADVVLTATDVELYADGEQTTIEDVLTIKGCNLTTENNVTYTTTPANVSEYVTIAVGALSKDNCAECGQNACTTETCSYTSDWTFTPIKNITEIVITATYKGDSNHNSATVIFKLKIRAAQVVTSQEHLDDSENNSTVEVNKTEVAVGDQFDITITPKDGYGWVSYQISDGEKVYNDNIYSTEPKEITVGSDMIDSDKQVKVNVVFDKITQYNIVIEGDAGSLTADNITIDSKIDGAQVSRDYNSTDGVVSAFESANTVIYAEVDNSTKDQYYAIRQILVNDETVVTGTTSGYVGNQGNPGDTTLKEGDTIKVVTAKVFDAEERTVSNNVVVSVDDIDNTYDPITITTAEGDKEFIIENAEVNIVMNGVTSDYGILGVVTNEGTAEETTISVDTLGGKWIMNADGSYTLTNQAYNKDLSTITPIVEKKLTDAASKITITVNNPNVTAYLQHVASGYKYAMSNVNMQNMYMGGWMVVVQQAAGASITIEVTNGGKTDTLAPGVEFNIGNDTIVNITIN